MSLVLDESGLCDELRPLLDDPPFQQGVRNLTNDAFFTAFFLVSVSQGEGLGESAVALIRQDELARRIRDLEPQERGHKQQTLDAARTLFPGYFVDGRYRFEAALQGATYYLEVLQANRRRLKQSERFSRLNLYVTTSFAYEVVVALLYGAVAGAMARSTLSPAVREGVTRVLERILGEEQTHLDVAAQHDALLDSPRNGLSREADSMLDTLRLLEPDDYRFPAELAVRQVVAMTGRYADPARYRARIESAEKR